jgi:hypothetical protein
MAGPKVWRGAEQPEQPPADTHLAHDGSLYALTADMQRVKELTGLPIYDARQAAEQAGLDVARDTLAPRLPFTLWPHVDGRTR